MTEPMTLIVLDMREITFSQNRWGDLEAHWGHQRLGGVPTEGRCDRETAVELLTAVAEEARVSHDGTWVGLALLNSEEGLIETRVGGQQHIYLNLGVRHGEAVEATPDQLTQHGRQVARAASERENMAALVRAAAE